jgi:hypothetical protein
VRYTRATGEGGIVHVTDAPVLSHVAAVQKSDQKALETLLATAIACGQSDVSLYAPATAISTTLLG